MATDNASSILAYERLGDTNYATWALRTKHALTIKGLWGAIDGTNPDQDDKAIAYLGMSVGDQHLGTIERAASARDAWSTLRDTFKAKNAARTLALRREINSLKMGPDEPLTKYFGRAKDLHAMLRDAGLQPTPLPLPDHHAFEQLPWPADTLMVVCSFLPPARVTVTV